MTKSKIIHSISCLFIFLFLSGNLFAQMSLSLDLSKPTHSVSPVLYGLMTEEINHSYDGGLYAELIQNRIFKDNSKSPDHWSLVQDGDGKGSIALDHHQPINEALTVCLKLNIEKSGGRVGIANDGYWGIPVKPQTTYQCSFYAKASENGDKPLSVSIESNDGKVIYAQAQVNGVNRQWQSFTTTLTTSKNIQPTANARFLITTKGLGTYWFNLVSVFPPTYNNRVNGNRPDIMQILAGLKPSFLRFPGGNYLEGNNFSTRFEWKKTIGPLDQRPGHPSPWGYRSTDGMGLLEFLEWCEDLKIEPVLGVFAGYVLKGDYIDGEPFLKPFVDDALDEIEYVTGDVNTKWGAVRARDGHPQPFKLNYVEIGNEDEYDTSGSYAHRFAQFYHAIRTKHPGIKIISTVDENNIPKNTPPDVIDEHYYNSAWEMEEDANHFDSYSRSGPKIFVGEWATMIGKPTNNFKAALGDAAWMTGMERNSDVVIMASYAPLLVNVNPGAFQWWPDLIGYNAMSVYGSPSYYAQKMFSTYRGNEVIPVVAKNIPTQTQKLNAKDSANGVHPKVIPAMFYVATKSTQSGTIYLKVVNTSGEAQKAKIDVNGASKIMSDGLTVTLKADSLEETNSITEPKKIIPETSGLKGIGKSFNYVFPAYSISVLQIDTRL